MVLISKTVELTVHLRQPTFVRCQQCPNSFVALAKRDIHQSVSVHAGMYAYALARPSSEKMNNELLEKLRPKVEKALAEPDSLKIDTHCPVCRYPYPTRQDPKLTEPMSRRNGAIGWGVVGLLLGVAAWWFGHTDAWVIGLGAVLGAGFGASFGPGLDAKKVDRPLDERKQIPDSMSVERWAADWKGDGATVVWAWRTGATDERGHVVYPLPPRSLTDTSADQPIGAAKEG
jgi:hypothetical protein